MTTLGSLLLKEAKKLEAAGNMAEAGVVFGEWVNESVRWTGEIRKHPLIEQATIEFESIMACGKYSEASMMEATALWERAWESVERELNLRE